MQTMQVGGCRKEYYHGFTVLHHGGHHNHPAGRGDDSVRDGENADSGVSDGELRAAGDFPVGRAVSESDHVSDDGIWKKKTHTVRDCRRIVYGKPLGDHGSDHAATDRALWKCGTGFLRIPDVLLHECSHGTSGGVWRKQNGEIGVRRAK